MIRERCLPGVSSMPLWQNVLLVYRSGSIFPVVCFPDRNLRMHLLKPVMMKRLAPLFAFVRFEYKNYLRQHRYLRDLVAIVIFIILFEAFLTGDQYTEDIWIVFAVFAILLNLLTAPSVFFLEKGNTLYFLLSKPNGRRNLFISKVILIIFIDLMWIVLFALLYGLRFLSLTYFMNMPLKLSVIVLILLLSTLLLSLSYTYRPQLSWLIMILLVFGSIFPKVKLFPLHSPGDWYKILSLLLPPFAELSDLMVSVTWQGWSPGFLDVSPGWQIFFLLVAILQIGCWLFVSCRKMMRKDLI